jgi:hypothetical protein
MGLIHRIERLESRPNAMSRGPLFIQRRGPVQGWRGGVDVLRMPNESDADLKRRAARITGSPCLTSIMASKRPDVAKGLPEMQLPAGWPVRRHWAGKRCPPWQATINH